MLKASILAELSAEFMCIQLNSSTSLAQLTNLLKKSSNVIHIIIQPFKKFHAYYGTQLFIAVFGLNKMAQNTINWWLFVNIAIKRRQNPVLFFILGKLSAIHTLKSYLLKTR